MFSGLAKSLFGSSNDRYVASIRKIVDKINAFEPAMQALDDATLAGADAEVPRPARSRRNARRHPARSLCDGARGRESARWGMRHYDVQMIGGIVLHRGEIAEMRTGEGKTLVATLAAYLNALPGKGVHVVTVNDYLARRDAEWMGQVYNFLGLTHGDHRPQPRRQAAPRRLCRRHHLRHEQRIRLRLSARQYEVRPRRRWSSARSISRSSTRSIRS